MVGLLPIATKRLAKVGVVVESRGFFSSGVDEMESGADLLLDAIRSVGGGGGGGV